MGDQTQPNRGHPCGHGHALFVDQVRQGRPVTHLVAREYQLGPGYGTGVRRAPGIDVEHRHDGQYHILARQAHGVRHHRGIGMQHRRSV